MNGIILIEGEDLDTLLAALDTGAADIYRLRIWPSADGTLKVKANERVWTPSLGTAEIPG